MVRYLLITSTVLLLTTAQIAFADPSLGGADFVPISPIPDPTRGGQATSGNLAQYIDALFKLALAAGAALAAIYIAIGGFEYIFSEAMESKKNGRARIVNALFGLGILILVTIILFVINPQIININLFSAVGVGLFV